MNFKINWRKWVCILRKKKEGNLNDPNFEKKSTKNMR